MEINYDNLNSKTMKQLRQTCRVNRFVHFSRLNKHDLIEFMLLRFQTKEHEITCGVCLETKHMSKRVCSSCQFDICETCYQIVCTKCPQCRQIYINPYIHKHPYIYVMNESDAESASLIILSPDMRQILYPQFADFFHALYVQFDTHKILKNQRYVVTITRDASAMVYPVEEMNDDNEN
uniref:RING-type domain-containing protein n=1 Tax=viral metagenome TaxID=1070528 RepID=A0A6C0CPJ5_9ZZZZ